MNSRLSYSRLMTALGIALVIYTVMSIILPQHIVLPIIISSIAAVGSYLMILFNEKKKPIPLVITNIVTSAVIIALLWFIAEMKSPIGLRVGIAIIILGSLLWLYVTAHEEHHEH